ncbi:hypothetical protein Tco_0067095 [Tanacetum coccineum]
MKKRKTSKEGESSKDPKSKSSSTSKDTSRSQHRSSGKSAHAEEPSHTVDDSVAQQDPEFVMGHTDEQPDYKAAPTTWISKVARAEEPPTSFDELTDTPFDFSTFVMNRLNINNLNQEILVRPAFNLFQGTCKHHTELEYQFEECFKATNERLDCHNPKDKQYPFDLCKPLPLIQDHHGRQVIPKDYFINNDLEYLKGGILSKKYSTFITKSKAATYEVKWIKDLVSELWSPEKVAYDKYAYWVTKLKIIKWYNYGYMDEIEVRKDDQQLYTFKEFDFSRLCLQDIEDIRIVIQKRVEDLQLGVGSYQKKLNLTKTDTFRSGLRKRTAYNAYLDPQGVIYIDWNKRNRLIHTDELHKFSDDTLDDVQTALQDISSGLRMDYLPKKKWSNLENRRAQVMI